MYRVLIITAGLVGCASLATATAVWEESKKSAYAVNGKVISIADDNNETVIRIASANGTETFKVCEAYPGQPEFENGSMRTIREAFNHGHSIQANYNGPFDRCIQNVKVSL